MHGALALAGQRAAVGAAGAARPTAACGARGHRCWETAPLRPVDLDSTAPEAGALGDRAGANGCVVRARGLVKTVGRGRAARTILDGVDLDLHAGELVAITGRSGSGKSTLLNLLGGLDVADGGTIEVAGQRVTGAAERELSALRRREIGFVFQFFHLVPELTGEANVLLAARLPGSDPGATARAGELIEQLGLGEVRASLPHELSGGEQQRFAIARALVGNPRLLLADEPTGNLDQQAGANVLELLRRAAGEGRAVLAVTHEAETVAAADRVLALDGGLLC